MAKLTRAQLDTIIANNFPDNTSEDITPEKLREFASAVVESCSNDEDDVNVSGITPGSTNVIVHGTPLVPELVVNEAYIVRFVFPGQINALQSIMKTASSFTQPSGVFSGIVPGAVLNGFRYSCGIFASGQAATLDVQLREESQGSGAQHVFGPGALVKDHNLITTTGAVSVTYNKGGQFVVDPPLPLSAGKIFFVDVEKSAASMSITDLRVEVIVQFTGVT